MQKITSITDLTSAIELLEVEHYAEEQLLKEHFYLTIESFRPFKILEQKLKDLTTPSNITDNILGTLLGLGAGYLSKKIVVGGSGNLLRKFSGALLQFGVTKFIALHNEEIKLLGQFIIDRVFRKKETNS